MSKPVKLAITGDNSKAIKALNEVGATADRTAKRAAAAARRQQAAMDKMSTTAVVAGGALVAGFAGVVMVAGKFEAEMSKVGAVSGATGQELDKLSEAALKAGFETKFSASQAAQAQTELAKAGISTADILGGGLRGALALAAAGELDLATAANIAAQTMNVFGLEGKDVTRVADVLAAGANKSAADVQSLAEAMSQGALVAKQTGLSLEETVATLAMFADNALVGSDAGTSLKVMLQRLSNPADKAKKEMERLGLSAYDAKGNFVGLESLAGKLRTALVKMTPEQRNASLAVIFGSDAVRAAGILYARGAEGAREYTKAVSDQGAASRVASKYLDNLSGDLEALKGSLETALIQGGSKATGALRSLTQAATGVVNGFAAAPPALQETVLAITGIGGASLLAVGGITKLVSAGKEGIGTFTSMSGAARAGTAILAGALVAGGFAIGQWAKEKEEARQKTLAFTDALRADSNEFGVNTEEVVRNQLATGDLLDNLGKLSGSLSSGRAPFEVYVDAVQGSVAAQRELRAALIESGEATIYWGGQSEEVQTAVIAEWTRTGGNFREVARRLFNDTIANQIFFFSDLEQSVGETTERIGDATKALKAEAGAAKDSAEIARDLSNAKRGLADAVAVYGRNSEQARAAQRRYNQALKRQNDLNKEIALAERDAAQARREAAAAADATNPSLLRYAQRLREIKKAFDDAAAAGEGYRYVSSIVTITNPNALPVIGRASGGPVKGRTPYVVGEQGPELFVPDSAGTIIPNGAFDTAMPARRPALVDGSATATTTVPIVVELDSKVIAQAVVKHAGRVGGLPIRIRPAS
jgi:TP901 family phage tail tape measure protein